jgi:hypothetical protein
MFQSEHLKMMHFLLVNVERLIGRNLQKFSQNTLFRHHTAPSEGAEGETYGSQEFHSHFFTLFIDGNLVCAVTCIKGEGICPTN